MSHTTEETAVIRLIPFAANRNEKLGNSPPFNPGERLAYVRYITAFHRLAKTLETFTEIIFLHKDICAELAKLGAADSKLAEYADDCSCWADALDHMLARQPGEWRGSIESVPPVILCHCSREPVATGG